MGYAHKCRLIAENGRERRENMLGTRDSRINAAGADASATTIESSICLTRAPMLRVRRARLAMERYALTMETIR